MRSRTHGWDDRGATVEPRCVRRGTSLEFETERKRAGRLILDTILMRKALIGVEYTTVRYRIPTRDSS